MGDAEQEEKRKKWRLSDKALSTKQKLAQVVEEYQNYIACEVSHDIYSEVFEETMGVI